MKRQFRQGDIFIIEVEELPKNAKKIKSRVLAYGEATGHVHALGDGNVFDLDGVLFFHLTKETELKHQEHDPVKIPDGNYRVVRQKEYSPERIRYVQD